MRGGTPRGGNAWGAAIPFPPGGAIGAPIGGPAEARGTRAASVVNRSVASWERELIQFERERRTTQWRCWHRLACRRHATSGWRHTHGSGCTGRRHTHHRTRTAGRCHTHCWARWRTARWRHTHHRARTAGRTRRRHRSWRRHPRSRSHRSAHRGSWWRCTHWWTSCFHTQTQNAHTHFL